MRAIYNAEATCWKNKILQKLAMTGDIEDIKAVIWFKAATSWRRIGSMRLPYIYVNSKLSAIVGDIYKAKQQKTFSLW